MAEKSVLSLRGEINWVTGDYSNVINSTKRMMGTMNASTTAELRAGQRAREAVLGEGFTNIEQQEKQAADRLVKSKENAAQRMANVHLEAKRPPPLPPDAGMKEVKQRERNLESIVSTAESVHKRLQKIQEAGGRQARAGTRAGAGGFADFAAGGAGRRAADIRDREASILQIRQEILDLEKEYEEMESRKTSRAYYNRKERKERKAQLDEAIILKKREIKLDRELTGYDKEKIETDRKLGESKRRLGVIQKTTAQMTMKMERDLIQVNREFAEEVGRMRQEVGEGLWQAFTYATVAISAFWYKMVPMIETFKEFEAEAVNAQSIWKNSQEDLNELTDEVVQFGQKFGINMGKATEGLYQYASAGVEAAEAMQMLNHTLTLSMAVQGDHNTLAKLTTQTIMGFGMEFSDAAEVTDKFAHAINKSLIEWDDLASSIKFALPFFISTGQSLDQLLGALAVLTNRALEAGIAGRGLRQALAEFTQHAEDNSAAFHKMGVEILDVDGNMRELTDIAAQFQSKLGDGVKDMDIMMSLMEDLNIRGATAFVHLVQNADEFQQQVDDLQNSAGAAVEMAEIQQKSLANQIQLVRNAMQAPFLMSDKIGEQAGYVNEFAMILHEMVTIFESLIVVEKDGTKELTKFGQFIKDFVIQAMRELMIMMELSRDMILSFGENAGGATRMLHMFTVPLTVVLKVLKALGPEFITTIILYRTLAKILPINIAQTYSMIQAKITETAAVKANILASIESIGIEDEKLLAQIRASIGVEQHTFAIQKQIVTQIALKAVMFSAIYAVQRWGMDSWDAAAGVGFLAGAFAYLAIAATAAITAIQQGLSWDAWLSGGVTGVAKVTLAMGAVGAILGVGAREMMKPPDMPPIPVTPVYDTGGRVMYPRTSYATGGRVAGGTHFPVMVEPGETIIPKTQNMLGGGITLNMGDVYTNDAEDFAERVAVALPLAMRRQNDIGGI